jgi:dipeptidyl-peptidase 4
LYGELLLPETPPQGGKTPLIVEIYGGPAGQEVLDAWGAGPADPYNQLLAQHGFAVFTVDNRGTPGRGKKFLSVLKHEFGAVELKDQLASLDQLFSQHPDLDKSRTCIYGWSNGGSMTLYAMLHSDVFKCGVSGAPVTDWRLYDSIYTERYLGLPKQFPKAYQDSSMPAAAENLHGSLLLLHGTSDDNVHMQNSIQMVNALIEANKQFRLMLFPNKTHGVRGKASENRMQLMLDFFEQNLK